jgi:hypothetical protein
VLSVTYSLPGERMACATQARGIIVVEHTAGPTESGDKHNSAMSATSHARQCQLCANGRTPPAVGIARE